MAHGEYLLILGPLYLLLHFLASLAELFRQYRSRVESKREWNSKETFMQLKLFAGFACYLLSSYEKWKLQASLGRST